MSEFKNYRIVRKLVIVIVIFSTVAALMGIVSDDGPGQYTHETIRGETIEIYGTGIYKHMSAEVAPQGIAQDYVTLFIGIPLLLLSIFSAKNGSLKWRYLLSGILGYFLVTYLFYLMMGMYNELFLVYALLLAASFFAFSLTMLSFNLDSLNEKFSDKTPAKLAGGFLLFNTAAIAILWLGIVVPPLIEGSIYPDELNHYTTLVVQGLDLGLLLPLAFVSGLLLIKKTNWGFLLGPVYLIFLSLLMTALTAKIIAMGLLGFSIIPVIFIIPTFALFSIGLSVILLINIVDE
ncbi:MAG: hypothetical protein K9J16_15540 [Melioribacteraceae bacterium]|nr:hypothetical protein [Melioribacteraceae bacterium]MCF8353375.1 hypothetical protein [Melioribacteraceae bacterium]MCF8393046.1 hypothetical protein [Melioribacteraceae bacterium]MCF8419101.1 hypothetical protein [Melioribacteraceae bacterium]